MPHSVLRFQPCVPRAAACSLLLILAGCTTGPARVAAAPQAARTQTQDAHIAYVDRAIEAVRGHALHAERVDWPAATERMHRAALAANSTAALYGELDWLLQQLGDNHSFLQLDEAAQQAYTAHAGAPFRSSRAAVPVATRFKAARALEADDHGPLRRVTVPSTMGDEAAQARYAATLAGLLTRAPRPCAIALDFRGNGGGNMWPMLAGLSPLLGEATLGAFVEPGSRMEIRVRSGALQVVAQGKEQQVTALPDWAANPVLQALPVAVLIDGATGSSGEIVPLLLTARANTRTVGQPSYGASTSTEGYPLGDGANLVVVTSGIADSRGTLHMQGLVPDLPVRFRANAGGTFDPELDAARAWAASQACPHGTGR